MDNLETNLNELKDILNLSNKQIEDRKLSLIDFSKNGFPSKKDEDWKFIDLNKIISSKIPKIKFSNNLVSKKIENFHCQILANMDSPQKKMRIGSLLI